jgi:hypothetical protein
MRHYFTDECLGVNLRRAENKIIVTIDSDYARSNHKGQLYVSGEGVANDVLQLWKSIKTKKLLRMHVSFDEIDWYDDEVDVYETPVIIMERGLRKPKIGSRNHGSVPKDWSVVLSMVFLDLQTKKPILDCIKAVLGSRFTTDMEKQFVKRYNPIIKQVPELAK